MNAFISYSHGDSQMLDVLHKHLAQLKREGAISTWTDKNISAGAAIDKQITLALNNSQLFLALLSPDYIVSNYCYENEFKRAQEMVAAGTIIIVPLIIQLCDWLNTPFKEFKALPKDGKPVSSWENVNTAFLDVTQNLRNILPSLNNEVSQKPYSRPPEAGGLSRNYRVKKDFDSIEKMEFVENTFKEVTEFIKRYMEEVVKLDNIKTRTLTDTNTELECILVNRNKIATEAQLKLSTDGDSASYTPFRTSDKQISYSIAANNRPSAKAFTLAFDEFHLYWTEGNSYNNSRNNAELASKEIADIIWNAWLESVGIL